MYKLLIKSAFLIFFYIMLTGFTMAQEAPFLKLDHNKFDFGDIVQGTKKEHIFPFINNGDLPLIISDVITTCGCTAPEWPKDPVKKGDKGEIKIIFDTTGKIGKQNKVITIVSNSGSLYDRITLTANVIPGKKR